MAMSWLDERTRLMVLLLRGHFCQSIFKDDRRSETLQTLAGLPTPCFRELLFGIEMSVKKRTKNLLPMYLK
jgi:hypothetical protein